MNWRALVFSAVMFAASACDGRNDQVAEEDPRETAFEYKDFVIIADVDNYKTAVKVVKSLARKIPELAKASRSAFPKKTPNAEGWLTFPKKTCDRNGWDYPCDVPRGRYDDGLFLSIEQKGFWENPVQGHFVVVLASGPKGDKDVDEVYQAVKGEADARLETKKVYVGCMH
jgi:hypothetical protein